MGVQMFHQHIDIISFGYTPSSESYNTPFINYFLICYLFVKQTHTHTRLGRREKREKEIPPTCSLSKCSKHPGLGQGEARSPENYLDSYSSSISVVFCCFPMCISTELYQKRSNWHSKRHSNMGCQSPKQQFHHSATVLVPPTFKSQFTINFPN